MNVRQESSRNEIKSYSESLSVILHSLYGELHNQVITWNWRIIVFLDELQSYIIWTNVSSIGLKRYPSKYYPIDYFSFYSYVKIAMFTATLNQFLTYSFIAAIYFANFFMGLQLLFQSLIVHITLYSNYHHIFIKSSTLVVKSGESQDLKISSFLKQSFLV